MKINLDNIRNSVNSFFNGLGFGNIIRKPTRALYNASGFFARPIGIVGKNYDFIKSTLSRNIGTSVFSYDGYGTPISMLADTELNEKAIPWYKMDEYKNRYSNYLEYVNDIYFDGYMAFPNFMSLEDKIHTFTPQSLLLENNMVGVIRSYDISDTLLASKMLPNGVQSNPNSFLDTKLGAVNNFYLNATLNNANWYYSTRFKNGISSDAYDIFGFLGSMGMKNGGSTLVNASVLPQEALTVDMFNITPFDSDYGYGVFESTNYSNGLIENTSEATNQFIKKSILGYNLLSDTKVELSDEDITDYFTITGKKYRPLKNSSYLSSLTDNVGFDEHIRYSNKIRYTIKDAGYGNSKYSRISYVYAEAEGVDTTGTPYHNDNGSATWNEGVYYGTYSTYNGVINQSSAKKNDIINYTNQLFLNGKLDTLIGRFHTNKIEEDRMRNMLCTATSQYGISHGRNLLRKDHQGKKTNGYSNPYCRVWTFHHQYSTFDKLIRPFYDKENDIKDSRITDYQFNRSRLEDYGVRDKDNRLIRFAPTTKNEIKNCMFSIENLAWKNERDGFKGHEDQRGPFGGRIMWFPPYGLNFSENVSVNWSDSQFIGRGEKIYTYVNTERSGTLSFKLLIDHPSVLNLWREEKSNNKEASEQGSVDDVESTEQRILRFFAGCEAIEKAPEVEPQPKKEKETDVIIPEEPKKEPILVPHKESSAINFYVFYPNNYSGVDDWNGSKVKPIEYLLNGIGCQKDKNGDIISDLSTPYTQSGYECGKGSGISCGLDTSKTASTASNGTEIISYKATNKNGGTNYWGYRVDERYKDEVFRNINSYIDKQNHSLNSKGYTKLTNYHTDAKGMLDEGTLYSLADVACALMPQAKNVLKGQYDEGNVEALKILFDEYDVLSVHTNGFASSHGYVSNNNELNKHRAETVNRWLQSCMSSKFTKEKCKVEETKIGPKMSHNNANDIVAKVWRGAKCTIYLEKEELVEKQRTNSSNDEESVRVGTQGYEDDKIEGLTNVGAAATKSAVKYNTDKANSSYKEASDNVESSSKTKSNGYGNEYEFFDKLESKAPFLHNKIVDKIKYFDPAYHSITPEGYNARLTFLHQCTRQGATHSAMDLNGTRTASNLSFGAPPICVLRIGDFYYTKIIIESLSINADDLTWDLNDEGIGVMPMIANIDITFKFLGGSDLSGPITRLQNAVSFNYYANTSVYDDRSELVEYDDKGNIISFKKNQ